MGKMASAEKNDVSLDKLWKYGNKITILDRKGTTATLFMRLVGDAELNRARVFALRKSAELRNKLRDVTSDEYIAYVPEAGSIERGVLQNTALTLCIQGFTREALRDLPPIPLPAEVKADATLEEQEEHQKEVDAYPQRRSDSIRDFVARRVDEETKALDKLTDQELANHYKKLIINDLCEQEMLKRYQEMCIYFGTYKDKNYSERLFTSFELFDNIPSDVKDQLSDAYTNLDISAEELKK